MIAGHQADDLGLASRQGLQRGSECIGAPVDLPPGQDPELVDQAGPVWAALRGQRKP